MTNIKYYGLDRRIKLMNQSIPFKSIDRFNTSVTVILISDIIFFDTGLNKALFGSNVNGNDLLKLSVGIIISVFVNTLSLILSVIRSQFMFMTSILLVIFGSFLLSVQSVLLFWSGNRSDHRILNWIYLISICFQVQQRHDNLIEQNTN